MSTIGLLPALDGKRISFLAIFGFLAMHVRATDDANVLWTSPRGTFRIEERFEPAKEAETEWVVSRRDPNQRARLPKKESDQLYDLSASPDEQWIAANVHYGSKMAGLRLYRHKEGMQFELVLDEGPAWKWLDRSKAEAPSAADMMRYSAWSSDSARLMLRTPIGGEGIGRGIPTANYFFYYNLRSCRFELTDYLRKLNRDALRILHSKDPEQDIAEPQAVEPIDPLPSLEVSRARYEAAGQKLNKVYGELMRKLKAEEKTRARDDQRAWIKSRESGADAFAAGRTKEARETYHEHYMAEATELRVRELEEWLKRSSE